jgi:imidazolonepropionase
MSHTALTSLKEAARGGISLRGAQQVLRFPDADDAFLRHNRAHEITLRPGSLCLSGETIAAHDDDPAAGLVVDASGCAIIPGLIDAHTHLPFAGWRAEEYERKVTGVPYEEIARAGGGIASSSRSFARMSDAEVVTQARGLADEMLAHGTTTFECKSGYGLSVDAELRALRLAQELGNEVAQATVSTALLAHAVPPGTDADAWMDTVERELAPRAAEQTPVQALDIFVESIAFSLDHLRRMGTLAADLGVDLRCHVEQLSTMRSVPVALELGARSVDHLACLHPDDLAPLAGAPCAAVLLPGAEVLGNERVAPARQLADAGAICVLATDANPGTSPVVSLPLIIGLAVRRYGWSVREALLATTKNPAWVLRRSHEAGALEPGMQADVVLLDAPVEHVPYRLGHNPVAAVFVAGVPAYVRPDQAWRLRIK